MSRFNGPPAPPPPIPPAPPLPPQRYAHRATNALARFAQPFIYGSRPPSAHGNRPEDVRRKATPTSVPRSSSPLSSQTTTHATGLPIQALDISPQRTHVVLAGREILKTVRVSGATCTEEFDLRSEMVAFASRHQDTAAAGPRRQKGQLAANDVKWSHSNYDTTIVAAAANGMIVVYDVNRPGVELARLHEHNRQVHRVAINPHHGALLLSGSQDTTVRLWDLREVDGSRGPAPPRSKQRYMGNSEGVRDLRWSPTDGVEFAFCTDNGVIQRWDYRKPNAPLLKINAHAKLCQSICWHPDGKHLASAGSDKEVKVWDFASTDRRQKPVWHFRAPQVVLNVRWRPPCWSAPAQGPGAWECTHLATSYNQSDSRVHLWDFRRPHIPYREFDRYDSAPTDMLWHSEDFLWTVGLEGVFAQTDVHFAPKVIDRQSLQSFDWRSDGSMSFFLQSRSRRRISDVEYPANRMATASSNVRISNGEVMSAGRSDFDDGVDESFLSSSFKRRHGRSLSMKSSKSQASTPPSTENNIIVTNLELSLANKDIARPVQLAARGRISGVFDLVVFTYLACRYDCSSLSNPDPRMLQKYPMLDQRARKVFFKNARYAWHVGLFRRSQSWKILGLAVIRDLQITLVEISKATQSKRINAGSTTSQRCEPEVIEVLEEPSLDATRLLQSAQAISTSEHRSSILGTESSSNMPTPQARPREVHTDVEAGKEALPNLDNELFSGLPPPNAIYYDSILNFGSCHRSGWEPPALPSRLTVSRRSNASSADITDQRAQWGEWNVQPRPILTLDPTRKSTPEDSASHNSGDLDRRDSEESFFMMFSPSTDSSRGARSLASSYEDSQKSRGSDSFPGRLDSSDVGASSSHGNDEAHLLNQNSSSESDTYLLENAGPFGRSKHDEEDDYLQSSGTIVPDDVSEQGTATRPPGAGEHPDYPADIDISITAPSLESQPYTPSATQPSILTPSNSSSSLTQHQPILGTTITTPWHITALLAHFTSFQTNTLADVQSPSTLILLLSSLFPNGFIPHDQSEAILESYHEQLLSLNLYNLAVQLRRLCVSNWPVVCRTALDKVYVALRCGSCKEAFSASMASKLAPWICEKCQTMQGPCSVCRLRHPACSEVWIWCQRCGHGGHEACLEEWWEDEVSEGECATEGCLHDCVTGARRDELGRQRARRKDKGFARADSWSVGESKAVERVRGTLAAPLSLRNPVKNPPAETRKVRLMAPGEEGR